MSNKQLWAPWRMDFINDGAKRPAGCIFCGLAKETDDRKNLIVHRDKRVFVILNKYPYNNGHLMVVPNRHTADFLSLEPEERNDLMEYSQICVDALNQKYHPEGYNLGMNIGAAAGAGVKDHLHLHIVPRWNGDTNFMPVIADTKSMPQHLEASFDLIHDYFKKLEKK